MHTDSTLNVFDRVTSKTGAKFRKFVNKTCPAFDTYELDREKEARKRRQAQQSSKNLNASRPKANNGRFGAANASSADTSNVGNVGRRKKTFNYRTYKYHSLGDYADTIRHLGTTDSYSTEPVSRVYKFRTAALTIFDRAS